MTPVLKAHSLIDFGATELDHRFVFLQLGLDELRKLLRTAGGCRAHEQIKLLNNTLVVQGLHKGLVKLRKDATRGVGRCAQAPPGLNIKVFQCLSHLRHIG